MRSQVLFYCVTWALLWTIALNANRPSNFYLVCIALQVATMVGIVINSFLLIQVGHVGFVAALYIGSVTLCFPDVWLVRILCVTAVVTRRLFDGCLFDLVSQCTYTSRRYFDIAFILPLLLSFLP